MAFQAAFYRGTRPGIPGIYNRLVRARGRGPHSHMELIFSDGLSGSASFADGGVRLKKIEYSDPFNWDILDLPPEWEARARRHIEARLGRKYDLMGNVHLMFGFLPDSSDREFCSELGMGALGFDQPFRFEPNAAYVVLLRALQIYRSAGMQLAPLS